MSDPENIHIPEDPVADIIESLRDREAQRRRAVDLAFQGFEQADNEDDRRHALNTLADMMGVLEGFRNEFPEVFPPEPPKSE